MLKKIVGSSPDPDPQQIVIPDPDCILPTSFVATSVSYKQVNRGENITSMPERNNLRLVPQMFCKM